MEELQNQQEKTGLLSQTWKWFHKNEKTLAAVGAVISACGSIAVAWQASAIANQAKITAVLSFQEKRIQEEALVNSFKKVNKAVLEATKKTPMIDNVQEYEEFRKYVLEVAYGSDASKEPEEQGIEDDIQLALSFYRGVANCVKQGACDRDAATAIFKDDVEEFIVAFAPYFCDISEDIRSPVVEDLEDFYNPQRRIYKENQCSSLAAFQP